MNHAQQDIIRPLFIVVGLITLVLIVVLVPEYLVNMAGGKLCEDAGYQKEFIMVRHGNYLCLDQDGTSMKWVKRK